MLCKVERSAFLSALKSVAPLLGGPDQAAYQVVSLHSEDDSLRVGAANDLGSVLKRLEATGDLDARVPHARLLAAVSAGSGLEVSLGVSGGKLKVQSGSFKAQIPLRNGFSVREEDLEGWDVLLSGAYSDVASFFASPLGLAGRSTGIEEYLKGVHLRARGGYWELFSTDKISMLRVMSSFKSESDEVISFPVQVVRILSRLGLRKDTEVELLVSPNRSKMGLRCADMRMAYVLLRCSLPDFDTVMSKVRVSRGSTFSVDPSELASLASALISVTGDGYVRARLEAKTGTLHASTLMAETPAEGDATVECLERPASATLALDSLLAGLRSLSCTATVKFSDESLPVFMSDDSHELYVAQIRV